MWKKKTMRYLEYAMAGISRKCKGRILEVPVGTGVLTMPVYQGLPSADVTCLDYSADMMARAKRRAKNMGLSNVRFLQGDVGKLPFADASFDLVLSLNGFHAFPDKDAAYREILRVLRPGGIFTGCFYIIGENKRTDWFINHIYVPKGFFTPPFETAGSLKKRLSGMFEKTSVRTVESMACFTCRKAW
ncbi:class I SAM-dependent methyltransferase [Hungatella effluvii]|nr:class I SAM-dependent methyltransferase [Hungatella effluvii]